jgi:uncharacterized protein (DUF1697 family)
MPAFVALLRGVNVGTARRVPMAALRQLLGAQGYTDVQTLLNSGNAVFSASDRSAARHARAIEGAIAGQLGLAVPVIVVAAADLARIIDECPFDTAPVDPARLLVAFAQEADALTGLKPLASLAVTPERFHVGARAAYLHCPEGILGSAVGKALVSGSGRLITTRNWATTRKLQALVRGVA